MVIEMEEGKLFNEEAEEEEGRGGGEEREERGSDYNDYGKDVIEEAMEEKTKWRRRETDL